MTLTLTPDTEAMLISVAAQRGLTPEKALNVILSEAATDFEEAVTGIQRGMDDFAAGRWVSLEDYEAEMLAELRTSVENHAAGRSMTVEDYRARALVRRKARNAQRLG